MQCKSQTSNFFLSKQYREFPNISVLFLVEVKIDSPVQNYSSFNQPPENDFN